MKKEKILFIALPILCAVAAAIAFIFIGKDTTKEDGLRIYCKSCCKKSKKKYRSNEKLYLIRVMLSMLEPIRNKKIQREEAHSAK